MRTVFVPSNGLRAGLTSSSRSRRASVGGQRVDQLRLDRVLDDRVAVARDALEVGGDGGGVEHGSFLGRHHCAGRRAASRSAAERLEERVVRQPSRAVLRDLARAAGHQFWSHSVQRASEPESMRAAPGRSRVPG